MRNTSIVLVLFGIISCAAASNGLVVYSNDFQGVVGPEWSSSLRTNTPAGNRTFLGEFANDDVRLTLTNLPPQYTNLTVSFDLLIMRTWDGVSGGPDYWQFRADGSPIFQTTFTSQSSSSHGQSYPEAYPNGYYAKYFGARETNTLGYATLSGCTECGDSIYHLTFDVLYHSNQLVLEFMGSNLEAFPNETWGLDNVVITAGGPRVSIVGASNLLYSAPANVTVQADVGASVGVARVEFYQNNTLSSVVTNPPYVWEWRNVPAGVYHIRARATDADGFYDEAATVVKVNGLLGEYFAGRTLSGTRRTRFDPEINFTWAKAKPISGLGNTEYSVRWTGSVVPPNTGTYTFRVANLDDGFRLWVDGVRLLDAWKTHYPPANIDSIPITLTAGEPHVIMAHYFQGPGGGAAVTLKWSGPGQALAVVPQGALYPLATDVRHSPMQPLVSEPAADGDVANPTNLIMATDGFFDADFGDTQAGAEWEIWTVMPSERVWLSTCTNGVGLLTNWLSNGQFMNSHSGRVSLMPDRDFVLRVCHKDNSGAPTTEWGGWGERLFSTRLPVISQQPQSFIAFPGETRRFTVVATNIVPYATYQWSFNGNHITGATNDILCLTNIHLAQAGSYGVVVGNPAGLTSTVAATLTVDTSFAVYAQSFFDTGTEGWTAIGDPTGPPSFIATGGSPGGFIQVTDRQTGATMYWVAPSMFLGNMSGCYGGYLEFDLRQSTPGNQQHDGNVILQGGGIKLVCNATYNPATTWTFYRVPLDETAGWRMDSATGLPATQIEMLRALSSLDQLQIRAEFSTSVDTDGLDNVMFIAPACTPATMLVITKLGTNAARLEWPATACGFTLEAADHLPATNWSSANLPIVLANGFNTVTIEREKAGRFYRLRQP